MLEISLGSGTDMTLQEYWERLGNIAGWQYQYKMKECIGWGTLLSEIDEELWLRNMDLYQDVNNDTKIEEIWELAKQLHKEYPELFV